MPKHFSRPVIAALALTMGLTGAAQAGPLNIWTASRQAEVSTPSVEGVQYRRHHRHNRGISPGAAAAIGIGAVAVGAAIAAGQRDRYYDDRYYDDRGGYYEGRSSYRDRGYCDNRGKPKHYPAPAGC